MSGPNPSFAVKTLAAVAATATPTQLPSGGAGVGLMISVTSASAGSVFIGDATVTAGTGLEMAPGAREFFRVSEASKLWVVAATTASVRVMTL